MHKAQHALEFLMTYSWAVFVIIGIFASLVYFGVLTPDKFKPDKCIAPPVFICKGSSANTQTNQLQISMYNAVKGTTTILHATLEPTKTECILGPNGILANGERIDDGTSQLSVGSEQEILITVDCSGGTLAPQKRIDERLILTYGSSENSLIHTKQVYFSTEAT